MTFCIFSEGKKSLVILISYYKKLVIFIFTHGILWQNVVGYTLGIKINNCEVRFDNFLSICHEFDKKIVADYDNFKIRRLFFSKDQ